MSSRRVLGVLFYLLHCVHAPTYRHRQTEAGNIYVFTDRCCHVRPEQGGIYLRLPRWGYQEWIWDHLAGVVVITVSFDNRMVCVCVFHLGGGIGGGDMAPVACALDTCFLALFCFAVHHAFLDCRQVPEEQYIFFFFFVVTAVLRCATS